MIFYQPGKLRSQFDVFYVAVMMACLSFYEICVPAPQIKTW